MIISVAVFSQEKPQKKPKTFSLENLDMKASIYKIVEEMPRFPGCEDESLDKKVKEACAKVKFNNYITEQLESRKDEFDINVEASAVVQFLVYHDAKVEFGGINKSSDVKFEAVVKEIVESMNSMREKWIPGKQFDTTVTVLLTQVVDYKP